MSVDSTLPTSRRGYLSQDELEQYADISVTDGNEADDRISQAEELIDAYCGYQCRFLEDDVLGKCSATGANSITLESSQQNVYENDYFRLCEVEILSGTGQGQRRKITGSTKAGVLTTDSNWTTTPDTTSFYRIYQLGKFPRDVDVSFYSTTTPNTYPNTYIKRIPENIKRAVVAQVEYIIEMGDAFFRTNEVEMESESIGDYSYTKGDGEGSVLERMVSPKAKLLLRGFRNKKGKIIV